MDLFTLFDMVAVIAGVGVYLKVKSSESAYLALFFAISSGLSFALSSAAQSYDYDLSRVWIYTFTALPVLFGILSRSHPVVLGYIAYLVVIGMNEITPLEYYSLVVYSVYAVQLIMVLYAGHNFTRGSRNHLSSNSHANFDS